jgi:hypothetical protein
MASAPDTPTPSDGRPPATVLRSLSPRVTAALAGLMLAIGAAVGAAIGPAPSTSFAGSRLAQLIPTVLAAAGAARQPAAQPPAATPAATPAPAPATPTASPPSPAAAPAPATSPSAGESAPSASAPGGSEGAGGSTTLAPVTHVWLIELAGSTFATALAQPSLAPYINGQALPAGALLSGWSGLAAAAFANEAASLASPPPQLLSTVIQPACPEGPAGTACAAGTPGELTAADEFLRASIPTITSAPAYREHGLIVVTFGSISAGSASGLPSGSSSVTLTALPPAGALLISPFAAAGTRPSTVFDPTSPKQSVERLLRR